MKDLEYPRLMYRPGTAWELESGTFDLLTVKSADEAEAAHADGWRLNQYAAGEVAQGNDSPALDVADRIDAKVYDQAVKAHDKAATRAELEAQAKALGLTWHHKTGDKKLAELIAAAS